LGISVAHDRIPYFDSTTAFEYIYPNWASVTVVKMNGILGKTRRSLLGKGAGIIPKEFKECIGVRLYVELHLSLFDDL
jgi:hypothetical protein